MHSSLVKKINVHIFSLQITMTSPSCSPRRSRCLHGSANTIQSTSGYDSEQRKLETRKEMFPDNNDEEIYQALRQAHFEVRGAVNNHLLFGLRGMPLSVPECLPNWVASFG